MTKKDPKELLKQIKAEMSGVDPKDISFKDLRKNTKKKYKKVKKSSESESESDIITNKEGFSISGVETTFCDYRDIGKKKKLVKKSNLDEWGAFDFFRFARKLYLKKYERDWDLNIGGNSLEINRIRDKFYDCFGFCCNLIMKDYIVYFFENHIDDCISRNGEFYFTDMRKDWPIKDFIKNYNFRESFANYFSDKSNKNNKIELTKDGINKSFSVGDTTLIGNYGVVISLNWLLKVKRMPKKDAVKLVVDACRAMAERGMIDVVKKSTEVYSPYPSNLLFKSPQLIFDKINKNIIINVEFTDNEKMIFLQKGT